jgi:chorismate synthase
MKVTAQDIQAELGRRRLGYGRGPRQRFEQDEIVLIGGIRHGRTLGSPVAIEIKNSEWFRSDVWHEEMSPAPGATKKPLTQPRPGHADLTGMQKSPMRAMCWNGRVHEKPLHVLLQARLPSCC